MDYNFWLYLNKAKNYNPLIKEENVLHR